MAVNVVKLGRRSHANGSMATGKVSENNLTSLFCEDRVSFSMQRMYGRRNARYDPLILVSRVSKPRSFTRCLSETDEEYPIVSKTVLVHCVLFQRTKRKIEIEIIIAAARCFQEVVVVRAESSTQRKF